MQGTLPTGKLFTRYVLAAFSFTILCAPLVAQIVPTPTQVTATVGVLSCVLTASGANCTVNGKPYNVWTPVYSNGADASIDGITWNGLKISPTLSFHGTVINWSIRTRTASGVWTPPNAPASGTFVYPPVAANQGPKTMGTLVNGKCLNLGTTFHPSFDKPVNTGQPGFVGATMVADQRIVSNCELEVQ